jgi:hypothetical protein
VFVDLNLDPIRQTYRRRDAPLERRLIDGVVRHRVVGGHRRHRLGWREHGSLRRRRVIGLVDRNRFKILNTPRRFRFAHVFRGGCRLHRAPQHLRLIVVRGQAGRGPPISDRSRRWTCEKRENGTPQRSKHGRDHN